MTTRRMAYADAESTEAMCADCHEVEHNLHIDHRHLEDHLTPALGRAPGPVATRLHSHYDVSEDLARRADGLQLHFD